MQQSAGQHGNDLKSTKAEIADMNRRIMRLQSEIEMVKAQVRIDRSRAVNTAGGHSSRRRRRRALGGLQVHIVGNWGGVQTHDL